jgi:hypothetical protein
MTGFQDWTTDDLATSAAFNQYASAQHHRRARGMADMGRLLGARCAQTEAAITASRARGCLFALLERVV